MQRVSLNSVKANVEQNGFSISRQELPRWISSQTLKWHTELTYTDQKNILLVVYSIGDFALTGSLFEEEVKVIMSLLNFASTRPQMNVSVTSRLQSSFFVFLATLAQPNFLNLDLWNLAPAVLEHPVIHCYGYEIVKALVGVTKIIKVTARWCGKVAWPFVCYFFFLRFLACQAFSRGSCGVCGNAKL